MFPPWFRPSVVLQQPRDLGRISTAYLDWRMGPNANRPERRLGTTILHVVIASCIINVAFDVFELFCTDITLKQNPFCLHCTLRWYLQSIPWSHVFHIQVGHAQYSQCFRMTNLFSLGLAKDTTLTWCQQENTNDTVLYLSNTVDLRLWRRKPHADAPSIGSNCWCWPTPVQVHSTEMICWNETKRPQLDECFGYYTVCTLDSLFQEFTKHVLQLILKLFILQKNKTKVSLCVSKPEEGVEVRNSCQVKCLQRFQGKVSNKIVYSIPKWVSFKTLSDILLGL